MVRATIVPTAKREITQETYSQVSKRLLFPLPSVVSLISFFFSFTDTLSYHGVISPPCKRQRNSQTPFCEENSNRKKKHASNPQAINPPLTLTISSLSFSLSPSLSLSLSLSFISVGAYCVLCVDVLSLVDDAAHGGKVPCQRGQVQLPHLPG
jgi:hypothetical protein